MPRRGAGPGPRATILIRIISTPAGRIGVALVSAVTVAVLAAPVLAWHDPVAMARGFELQPPSSDHLLGTDQFGRDIWSRIAFGGRVSLAVGVVAVLLGSAVGVSSGLVAGYFGGLVDRIVMRVGDGLLAFPAVILAITITAVVGPSPQTVALAVGIVSLPTFARLTRAIALVQKQLEYITAARCLGLTDLRIIVRHLYPNVLPPILVQTQVAMAQAVLLEAGLSFLGFGVRLPEPSWGGMLAESRGFLREAPWMALFPGLALSLFVLGLFLLGDALREALSTRSAQAAASPGGGAA